MKNSVWFAAILFCGSVLLAQEPTIPAAAANEESLKTFSRLVGVAGLSATLAGPGPFTVFAPTDDAFKKLPKNKLDALLAKPAQLRSVILYHVLAGKIGGAALTKLNSPRSLQGGTLKLRMVLGKPQVNNATVMKPDIACSNGILHVIDEVLLPK